LEWQSIIDSLYIEWRLGLSILALQILRSVFRLKFSHENKISGPNERDIPVLIILVSEIME